MNKFNRLRLIKRLFSDVNSAKKTIKYDSFVYKSFFGELDKDFLKFPKFTNVDNTQYETIRRDFKSICSDNKNLKEKGILCPKSFSTLELIRFFEAIGSSLNFKSEFNQESTKSNSLVQINDKLAITKSFIEEYNEKKSFIQAILPILIHNALVLPTLNSSLPSTTQIELSNRDELRTAFAFCELNEKFASLPHTYWNSTATFDEKEKRWILSGSKNRILKADYKQYLVFCRVKNSDDSDKTERLASFLLSSDEVSVENDGNDNYGNQYLRIEFSNIPVAAATVLGDNEISVLNVKARGQLAVAALIYGIIRQIFCNAISKIQLNYTSERTGSKSVLQFSDHNLAHITQMLHSLESVLYQTTAHFDLYDNDKMNLYLQAMMIKILSTEYSTAILDELRLMFNTNELSQIMSGETINVLNVLDSFLDSANSNRLLLAANGLRNVGAWKFDHIIKMRLGEIYMAHYVKYKFFGQKKFEQRFENSYDDLKNFKELLNPKLHSAASQFETVLDKLKSLTDHLLILHGKEVVKHQIEMSRLSSIAISTYEMLAVIARTNDVLNYKSDSTSGLSVDNNQSLNESINRFGDIISSEVFPDASLRLCNRICTDHKIRAEQIENLIYGILDTSDEHRSRTVHRRNLRTDGYFPASTFDRAM